jgi:hypothetical protein
MKIIWPDLVLQETGVAPRVFRCRNIFSTARGFATFNRTNNKTVYT